MTMQQLWSCFFVANQLTVPPYSSIEAWGRGRLTSNQCTDREKWSCHAEAMVRLAQVQHRIDMYILQTCMQVVQGELARYLSEQCTPAYVGARGHGRRWTNADQGATMIKESQT
jgi:hypothetical protein